MRAETETFRLILATISVGWNFCIFIFIFCRRLFPWWWADGIKFHSLYAIYPLISLCNIYSHIRWDQVHTVVIVHFFFNCFYWQLQNRNSTHTLVIIPFGYRNWWCIWFCRTLFPWQWNKISFFICYISIMVSLLNIFLYWYQAFLVMKIRFTFDFINYLCVETLMHISI